MIVHIYSICGGGGPNQADLGPILKKPTKDGKRGECLYRTVGGRVGVREIIGMV